MDWREDLKAAYSNPANIRFAQAIESMFADLDSAKSEAINPTNTIGRVATLPIVLVGLIASDFAESRSANIDSIAWANLIFAGLLYAAFKSSRQSKSLAELTLFAALMIGCFQALAIFPGASRSGMAITGALIIGLNIKDTSRFAFLLSIPTILGALVLMVAKGAYSISFSDMLVMLTGFIGSAFIAFITIKSFLQFVEKIGMTPFVIYRVALGALLLLI